MDKVAEVLEIQQKVEQRVGGVTAECQTPEEEGKIREHIPANKVKLATTRPYGSNTFDNTKTYNSVCILYNQVLIILTTSTARCGSYI